MVTAGAVDQIQIQPDSEQFLQIRVHSPCKRRSLAMTRIATLKKIGERLKQALKRKGATTQQAMAAVGGRTLPVWYYWSQGRQEGGCRDIAQLGLFLGLTPDRLLLDDEVSHDKGFTEEDLVGFENLRIILEEMTALADISSSKDRPVAMAHNHIQNMLVLLKAANAGKV